MPANIPRPSRGGQFANHGPMAEGHGYERLNDFEASGSRLAGRKHGCFAPAPVIQESGRRIDVQDALKEVLIGKQMGDYRLTAPLQLILPWKPREIDQSPL